MSSVLRNRGQTLLELIAASALLAATLTPAVPNSARTPEQDRRLETLELLTTLCADKLEQHMVLTASSWSVATTSGDFSANGYAQLRFSVTCSDDAAAGGVVDQLMAITATVWEDANGNAVLDSGEPSTMFRTKVARLAGYPQ